MPPGMIRQYPVDRLATTLTREEEVPSPALWGGHADGAAITEEEATGTLIRRDHLVAFTLAG